MDLIVLASFKPNCV